MTWLRALLWLVLAAGLAAAGPAYRPASFDRDLVADVYATALDFIAPRILAPVSVGSLALHGLRGLTARDPALMAQSSGNRLRLIASGRIVFDAARPDPQDADDWGETAAEMAAAARAASAVLRRSGQQDIINQFFEELFAGLDPYSRYLPPVEGAAERAQSSGYAGIGAMLVPRGGSLEVAHVVAKGPAASAGLHLGDRIVAIDGVAADRFDAADALAAVDEIPGAAVTLSVRSRDGSKRTVTVPRTLLPPETVHAERRKDLLIVRLAGFSGFTARRLEFVLKTGLGRGRRPRGIVLDLRGNAGGSLDQAVDVAGLLFGSGPVASTVGRDPAANRVLQADGPNLSDGLPLIVLVDGSSASAAEILAAALADHRRAVVVGSSTQGKGLIQADTVLPDGGELYVSWSRVLAPLGWPIQDLGVLPQVCTSMGSAELDRQLQSLSGGVQSMRLALEQSRATRLTTPLSVVLGFRENCPASEGSEADMFAAGFLIRHPAAYAAALLPPQPPRQLRSAAP